MRGLKLRRGFPLNGRKMDKVTWTRTSDGMHSDHSDALRYSNSFLSLMCIVSTAALAPLRRPLRIHQPELVAGQTLVREVVCRITGEKDIGIREVSVERLCHAASNRRLFTAADVLPPEPPIEARDAAGVVEFDEVARDIRRRFRREHCSGRGGWRDLERLDAPESVELVQVVNSRTRPSLRVNHEAHLLRLDIELQ